jgi:hypothetical protein
MFNRVKKWISIIGRLPMENQLLRKDVARLARTCKQLEHQRNMWQEMHRAAGVGYMASQDMMMKEIIRLAEKAGEMPTQALSKVVEMYAEAHIKPHIAPTAEPAP